MAQPIQTRLLRWAGLFLCLYALVLTLSPAAREQTWNVDYRLSHWLGFFLWAALTYGAQRALRQRLPESDPYLFPAAALLSGWGLLSIWRLDETFGIRQTIWLAVALIIFTLALRKIPNLQFLQKYKYLLLVSGLALTALTLIFGANPMGAGPRLWLGCCGVYFQPSEPLKLLLVIYLSAYFADHAPTQSLSRRAWLIPTLTLTGITLALLLVQRDLGTASIFVAIFTVLLFVATGKRRILLGAGVFLLLALMGGYFFTDIIRARAQGWLNPWADPAGNSFQIIQSILAIANGGLLGRGAGVGSPSLVPVAISDFIFAAIAEETGLLGALGLLITLSILLMRGLRAALRAPDRFRRSLATGLVAYLGAQSLLIIGGNLRLFPLTGVTLPFVSYGGSSLLTSYLALLILLSISQSEDEEPAPLNNPQPYSILAGILSAGIFAAAFTAAWWGIVRAPDLLNRTDNPRRAIADRYVLRGSLLDSNNEPITKTKGESGTYKRIYVYPDLAPVTGYTHPVYGQAGLEAALDDYLRGLAANPASLVWWHHLLYGAPPPGLDVRLSLNLELQRAADEALGEHVGALILLNAQSGEILAMASHPTYDPNQLDEIGASLSQENSSPLVNRAAQGIYPIAGILPALLQSPLEDSQLTAQYRALGLFEAPALNLPLDFNSTPKQMNASPLQVSLAAAALTHDGIKPAPRLALAVNTPTQGWVALPAQAEPTQALSPVIARQAAAAWATDEKPYWQYAAVARSTNSAVTWLLAGTTSGWGGAPLALVIVLEEENLPLVQQMSAKIWSASNR